MGGLEREREREREREAKHRIQEEDKRTKLRKRTIELEEGGNSSIKACRIDASSSLVRCNNRSNRTQKEREGERDTVRKNVQLLVAFTIRLVVVSGRVGIR